MSGLIFFSYSILLFSFFSETLTSCIDSSLLSLVVPFSGNFLTAASFFTSCDNAEIYSATVCIIFLALTKIQLLCIQEAHYHQALVLE